MNRKGSIIIGIILVVLILVSMAGIYSIVRKMRDGNSSSNDPVLVMPEDAGSTNILFLHHSTGRLIWEGGVEGVIADYNNDRSSKFAIYEQDFPKSEPYGWNNYPYDYWNIWVNHAGEAPFKNEPTLEMITKHYDVIIFKHCFPVSAIQEDSSLPSIDSSLKTIENYKLQYDALKEKIHQFNGTKFIVWTPAALVKSVTNEDEAMRTKEFHDWMVNQWDEKGDNIYLWDLYSLETEGELYLKEEYAKNPSNSHPNPDFSKKVAPYFSRRLIDVIEGKGDEENITGM